MTVRVCWTAAWLLASLLFVGDCAQGVRGKTSRDLLQSSVLTVRNERSARNVFGNLEGGETVELAFNELKLTETLVVDKANVTIRGAEGGSKPKLRCPDDALALSISASGVTVENIVFDGCDPAAGGVVLVQAPESEPVLEEIVIAVSFSGVDFVRNNIIDFTSAGLAPLSIREGVNATITDCSFTDNRGLASGGIELIGGVMSVENSTFKNNTAAASGGAIWCDGRRSNIRTSVTISNCDFEANKVTRDTAVSAPTRADNSGKPLELVEYYPFLFADGKGGGVAVQNMKDTEIKNSTFTGNIAAAGGGLSILSDSGVEEGTIRILECEFDSNKADFIGEPDDFIVRRDEILQGGSIYMFITDENMLILMSSCTVTNSRAVFGGGMHVVTSDRTEIKVEVCKFEENEATKAGGGFLLRNGRASWFNSSVRRCKAEVGGGLLLTNNADFSIQGPSISGEDVAQVHSEFTDNSAVDGGGILCVFCGTLVLQGPRFLNNTADRNGGGLALLDGIAGIDVLNFLFEDNKALRGGGIYLDTTGQLILQTPKQFLDIGQPSTFRKNKAVAGGALFIVARSLRENVLRVQNTVFEKNEAVLLEHMKSTKKFPSDDKKSFRKLKQVDSTLEEGAAKEEGGGSTVQQREQDSLSSCGSGGGGAICLVLDEVPEAAIVRFMLKEVQLQKNKAAVGGAIFASVDGPGWGTDRCEDPPAPTANPCRSFRIETAEIVDNVAKFGGGGIFVSDPTTLYAKCENDTGFSFDEDYDSYDYDIDLPEPVDPSQSLLDIWKEGNEREKCIIVSGNVVKDSGGIFGPEFASSGVALQLVSPLDLTIVNQTSGQPLSFNGAGVELRIVDAFNQTVTGGVPENEIDVSLSTTSDAIRGQQIYKARKGRVYVNSTVALGEHVEHNLTFSAAQLTSVNTTFVIRDCFPGEEEEGNFKECSVCKIDKYSFIPEEGCKECESNAICKGGAALVPRPGYWHSTPFAPQFHECLIRAACDFPNRELGLTEFYENRGALMPSNTPADDVMGYVQCSTGYKGRLCGSCKDDYGHFSGGECVKCQQSKFTGFLIFLVAVWSSVLVLFEIFNSMSANRDFMKAFDDDPQQHSRVRESRNGPNLVTRSIQEAPQEYIPTYVEAFENLTETVKIFINYLQVTSLAVTINLSWNRTMKGLLRAQELVSGLSNGSAFIPLDCSFDREYEVPRSILAIWLRIMFPVMLLAFFLIVCVVGWLIMRSVQKMKGMTLETRSTLKTYVIIVTIAVVFFAYNGVTEELMRTVNCVDIDEDEDKVSANNPNKRFTARAGGQVWAEDTELVCFQGQHTATGVVGILGLVFFSFGFVVFIIALLTFSRNRVKDKEFLSRYGFLYRAYRTEYYTIYWEALVTLRKAFIGAAVVYAYPLGPNLQAVLALGILILALFFQLLFRPYRHVNIKQCGGPLTSWVFMELMGLNHLETFSILMSTITFYSGIVFNDSNTSDAGNILMAIFVLVMNGGYSVTMMLRIWGGLHVALDEKIKCLGSSTRGKHHDRMFWLGKIRLLVNHYIAQVQEKLKGARRPKTVPETTTESEAEMTVHATDGGV